MPAVIDPNVCDRNWAACFPARMCPQEAFSFDEAQHQVLIDDSLCGTCPGPCVNFCDQYAIRYALDPSEFEVLKSKTLGELTEEEAAAKLEEIKQEAEKAEKQAEEEAGPVVNASDDSFEQVVLQSELPVIVDFWAPWCGPCKQMAPVFDKLADQYGGNIRFVKVNVDENQKLAMQYRVSSIPTLALFWQGNLVDQFAGALSEPQLQSLAYQFLAAVRAQTPGGSTNGGPDIVTP
jgi:thioredoxin